jgi:hypothetical protein
MARKYVLTGNLVKSSPLPEKGRRGGGDQWQLIVHAGWLRILIDLVKNGVFVEF